MGVSTLIPDQVAFVYPDGHGYSAIKIHDVGYSPLFAGCPYTEDELRSKVLDRNSFGFKRLAKEYGVTDIHLVSKEEAFMEAREACPPGSVPTLWFQDG